MTIVGRFVRIFDLRSVILLLLLARESVSILFNQTSYIETNPVDITKQFTLSFRTCKAGTLLRQNGTSGDYFELAVLPGTMNYTTDIFSPSSLALRWQTTGSKAEVHVGSQMDQNKPYHVVFSPRIGSQNSSQNAALSVSLGNEVHTVQVPDAIYSVSADTLILGQGFVGCITFGDMFDLNVSKTAGTSEQCPLDSGRGCHREACRSGYKGYYCEINFDECGSSPCHYAATCEDGIANYTCSCGPAWFGRNCDNLRNKTFCDYKPCENGGICQPVLDFNNYICTCLPPWTGRNCTQTADPCRSLPCQNNATCRNIRDVNFQCDCLTGFAGRHCATNIDDCATADCGPQGKCVDGIARHTCNCFGTGYTGQDCKDDIDECSGTPPCKNNATCSNYAGGYLCTCVGDFQGTDCDEQIDDCLSKPCKNGGNCTDSIKDFTCACPPGFSGKSCETVLHPCNVIGCTACDVMPCNHGNCSCNCTDHSMFYNCSCEAGYRGARCDEDINECMSGSSPSKICGDNGTCRNTNGSFKCECSEGFTGKYCNETERPCNPNPCIHGRCQSVNVTANMNTSLVSGNSTNFTETYNCSCFDGWRGRNCSEDIDECRENIDTCNRSRSECMNTLGRYDCRCFAGYEGGECEDIDECRTIKPCFRGKCENEDGDYACYCPAGFSGKNCSINLNECFDKRGNKECQHGSCEDGIDTFTCICDVGWTGRRCDIDVDECFLGYCKNNISCNNTDGIYSCTCLAGYTDVNCTTDIDDCLGSPCLHDGMCMDKVNDYECNCTHGCEGKSCEVDIDWCNVTRNNGYVPCDYGICEDGVHNYTCQCFDGFSGQNCSIDENECTDMPCKNDAICVQKSNATAVMMYFGPDRIYPKNESAGYLCVCQPVLHRACHGNGTKKCDDGINDYTCICNNCYKEPATDVLVTPINPTAVENSSIVFSCNCGCSLDGYYSWTWFKHNQFIRYNQSRSPYTLLANGSLRVNVSRKTAGNYSCQLRTYFWSAISKQVKLTVWYLDDCYVTGDQDIFQGQNVSLTCNGGGEPYPTFTWYLREQELTTSTRISMQGNQLNVFNATTNDGGKYTCVAHNKAGNVSHGLIVTVREFLAPELRTESLKYILNGTAFSFTCNVQRYIEKMQLVKDGIAIYQWAWPWLPWRVNVTSPTYTAWSDSTGTYQCKGTIGAASRYSSPFYLVVGIPSEPVVLEKEPETSTTGIKLSWRAISKEFWNGEAVTFEVNVSSIHHVLLKSLKTKTTSAIISGLLPTTTYRVMIGGSTVFGSIPNVTEVVVKTKENKNSKKFQLQIRLTNLEFSNNLMDSTSSQHKKLKAKLETSLGNIYKESAVRFRYTSSSVFRFKRGSVVVSVAVSLDKQFKDTQSVLLVQELNKVDTLAGFRFDKSYTHVQDFDECANADSNACHEYANCTNIVATYICTCFDGFFGDGENCQGPPQITSKSPANITQKVETNVTLVCVVIGDPKPVISWKRNDSDGELVQVKSTQDKFDGNYTIVHARLEDSGTYLCNASNPLGYQFYSTELIIKPVIAKIDVEIKLSNKTFNEELKNESSPAYKELKNDVYVELFNFFNNTPGFEDIEILGFVNGSVKVLFRVIIKVLKPSKETNDVVAVKIGRKINKQLKTGRIGNIQVVPDVIKLNVAPPPPRNITFSDVRETSVHIYWKPPELHEMFSLEKYHIKYIMHGGKKWNNNSINADQSSTNLQLRVDNLESNTFYIFKIIAQNKFGTKESKRIEIKTMKDKVVSPWYYIAPIIAVSSIVLVVIAICVARRICLSDAWKLDESAPNSDKKESKASFQLIERGIQNKTSFPNTAFLDTR